MGALGITRNGIERPERGVLPSRCGVCLNGCYPTFVSQKQTARIPPHLSHWRPNQQLRWGNDFMGRLRGRLPLGGFQEIKA
jgi:hypothetical protein